MGSLCSAWSRPDAAALEKAPPQKQFEEKWTFASSKCPFSAFGSALTAAFPPRMFGAPNSMMLDKLAAVARKDYEDRRSRQAQGITQAKAALRPANRNACSPACCAPARSGRLFKG